ncbi:MAG: transcription antitermination factor NusB [Porticoccaceae bacterium]|nr:transcription antitermination factor NusB [Porticoccaceae bacterium]
MSTSSTARSSNSKPSHRKKARHLLVQALYQWQLSGTSINSIEAEFFTDNKMDTVDTQFFRELLHGVPEKVAELDGRFTPYLDRRQDELDPVSLAVLRIGTYELLFRIDVPYKVVINESVNLAKAFGPSDAHKYINSILDKVAIDSRQVEIKAAQSRG